MTWNTLCSRLTVHFFRLKQYSIRERNGVYSIGSVTINSLRKWNEYSKSACVLILIVYRIVNPVNFLILVAMCFRFSCISRLESLLRLILGAPPSESLFAAWTVVIDTLLRALLLWKVQTYVLSHSILRLESLKFEPGPAVIKLFRRLVIKPPNVFRCDTVNLAYSICSFRSREIIVIHPHVINNYGRLGKRLKKFGRRIKHTTWVSE